MTQQDARFEDGGDHPLNLGALDAEDLQVVSTLAQDAIFPASEMQWLPKERRFAVPVSYTHMTLPTRDREDKDGVRGT